MLLKPIKDFDLNNIKSAQQLVNQMLESGGFTTKKVAIAVGILKDMLADKDSLNFLSFPA